MAVKGIQKALEDDSTGAPVGFFRLVQYQVDKRSNSTYGLLAGYVNEAKFDEAKNPMSTFNVNVQGVPESGIDTEGWIYGQVILPAGEGAPDNPFEGGTLVQLPSGN